MHYCEHKRDRGNLQVAARDRHILRLQQCLHHRTRQPGTAARDEHRHQSQQRVLALLALHLGRGLARSILLHRELHKHHTRREEGDGGPARLADLGTEQQPSAHERGEDLELVGDLEGDRVEVRECRVDDVVLHCVQEGGHRHLHHLGRLAEQRVRDHTGRRREALLRAGNREQARDALHHLRERHRGRVDVALALSLRGRRQQQVRQIDTDVAREEANAHQLLGS
mmetsp:Transcript_41640/g.94099  ORF Transcript_41640/g.94099 Transcript_41640/m.94099 type:complete len:226 (-) Transcript_41640:17-694(-)